MPMTDRIVVWIVESIWPACVDAARSYAPHDAEVVLLHVTGWEVADVAHGAYAGLLGRRHPGPHTLGHAGRFMLS
jgi:hypothetical protein